MAHLARVIFAALGAARGETRLLGRDHPHVRAILGERGHQSAVIGLRILLRCAPDAVVLENIRSVDGFVRRTPEAGQRRPAISGLERAITARRRAFAEIAHAHLRRAIMNFDRELALGNGALKPAQALSAAKRAQNKRSARHIDLAGLSRRGYFSPRKHDARNHKGVALLLERQTARIAVQAEFAACERGLVGRAHHNPAQNWRPAVRIVRQLSLRHGRARAKLQGCDGESGSQDAEEPGHL